MTPHSLRRVGKGVTARLLLGVIVISRAASAPSSLSHRHRPLLPLLLLVVVTVADIMTVMMTKHGVIFTLGRCHHDVTVRALGASSSSSSLMLLLLGRKGLYMGLLLGAVMGGGSPR